MNEKLYLFLMRVSPSIIGSRLFRRLFKFRFLPPQNDEAIRLNLGCGDKIIENYINVDIVESRKGSRPDVICDLKNLTFEDDYADEILSVHVVEHFYRWEIEEVLLEWHRVLKPGGKLVIECPNLAHAARCLLANKKVAVGYGEETASSMWVFYGDPQWRDPYMVHRWGYTPQSLCALLHDLGFKGATQKPALFKKKEPRDMRVVAYK